MIPTLDPYQCQRATRSVWSAHARASVYTLLLHAPGLVSCVRQHASCQPCMQLFGSCLGFAVLKENHSAGRVRVHTCCEYDNKRGYLRTWYVYKIFFFIFRLMRYTDVRIFSRSGVLFPLEYTIPQLNETVKHDNIRESDRHDRRYMYIPSSALLIYKTTCHAKP